MVTAVISINSTGTQHEVPTRDFDTIYEIMMQITGNDHEGASNAASWCELASIGETYEFREGFIEIVEQKSNRCGVLNTEMYINAPLLNERRNCHDQTRAYGSASWYTFI